MHIFNDLYRDDFLLDDDEDFSTELFEENEAVALEDLLHLVQEYGEGHESDLRPGHFTSDEDALVWGLSVLCETKLGRDLAFDARFEDWSIEVDDIDSNHHIIDSQLRILILPRFAVSAAQLSKSQPERAQFLLELARGLRGIWHSMTNIRENKDLTADDQILWERFRRLDHDVCALRMAWDLRTQGLGGLWRQVIASDLGDFAVICSEIWDQSRENEDELPLYGFTHLVPHWLKDEKLLNSIDSKTLDGMDARLQRSRADVCGPVQISASDVMTLSTLPAEGSYLAPLARTILYAVDFRVIPDPVNEAHLRQILEDCDQIRTSPLVFSDSELEKKIFPNRVDTIA
ncbi:MAG TPA: hypothetical protein PKI93_03080 [Alphaproteobacteria bacterium]|nr:hypothetical protein [Alphaproteobacteria bacterium]HNS44817.1 hypothetical protein [Alphaproteobacteria bacterium]